MLISKLERFINSRSTCRKIIKMFMITNTIPNIINETYYQMFHINFFYGPYNGNYYCVTNLASSVAIANRMSHVILKCSL